MNFYIVTSYTNNDGIQITTRSSSKLKKKCFLPRTFKGIQLEKSNKGLIRIRIVEKSLDIELEIFSSRYIYLFPLIISTTCNNFCRQRIKHFCDS